MDEPAFAKRQTLSHQTEVRIGRVQNSLLKRHDFHPCSGCRSGVLEQQRTVRKVDVCLELAGVVLAVPAEVDGSRAPCQSNRAR